MLEVNQPAPDFALTDSDGNPHTLATFAGSHLVLFFYPKDDTPGCTKEACGFRDRQADFSDLDVVIVGVSPDGPAAHAKFTTKYGLPFTLLCDPKKETMAAYGAWGEKMLYGKKKVGVIRSTVWIGPDGLVRKHWRRVPKAADHPQKVLEAIRKDLVTSR